MAPTSSGAASSQSGLRRRVQALELVGRVSLLVPVGGTSLPLGPVPLDPTGLLFGPRQPPPT